MSRAGKHVREMALRRRSRAITQFMGAGLLIVVPIIIPFHVRARSPTSLGDFNLPIWMYILCCLTAGLVYSRAHYTWRRANQADQGAKAEEDVAALLSPLRKQGWQIEYGIQDRQVGDVDVFLLSPKGHAYTIDVKSHKGYVYSTHKQLCRKVGNTSLRFEKNFLSQAKKQAIVMQRRKHLNFVTPLIVFSNARVGIRSNCVAGVYVVEGKHLLTYLRSRG